MSGSQTANKEAFDMTHANSAHNALREIRKTLDDMDAGLLEIRSLASALVTVLDQSKQDASAHETVHVLARLLHERAISPDLSADRTNHNLCVVYDCLTAKEFGHA
ncbi:hypothetical protein [Polycladidibacter stylochi]|uniref:hypothetical protein n=1 Tax=Polycladidibacter stylochi TaxID=1807766 RepID=UPI0012E370D5|nr:hypothetical protein [Pseudovibrio stylochi]